MDALHTGRLAWVPAAAAAAVVCSLSSWWTYWPRLPWLWQQGGRLVRVWAGWGSGEQLGLLGKMTWCVVRDEFSLWTASWQPSWEGGSVCDSRFIERVIGEWASPARRKQRWDMCVYMCACVGVHVCAEKSDKCTPMGRERGRSRRVALTPVPFFCLYQSSNTARPSSSSLTPLSIAHRFLFSFPLNNSLPVPRLWISSFSLYFSKSRPSFIFLWKPEFHGVRRTRLSVHILFLFFAIRCF